MSGLLRGMVPLDQQVTLAMDFLLEVAVMRWFQESSNATPCGKHRAQVLDNLRIWCQTLPVAFHERRMFHPFETISEQFLRDVFKGTACLAEHCPSFQKLRKLPLGFNNSIMSIIRNPASETAWTMLFSREEARDLSMTQDWQDFGSCRDTPTVLDRDGR